MNFRNMPSTNFVFRLSNLTDTSCDLVISYIRQLNFIISARKRLTDAPRISSLYFDPKVCMPASNVKESNPIFRVESILPGKCICTTINRLRYLLLPSAKHECGMYQQPSVQRSQYKTTVANQASLPILHSMCN